MILVGAFGILMFLVGVGVLGTGYWPFGLALIVTGLLVLAFANHQIEEAKNG